jgi:hypothetical protein
VLLPSSDAGLATVNVVWVRRLTRPESIWADVEQSVKELVMRTRLLIQAFAIFSVTLIFGATPPRLRGQNSGSDLTSRLVVGLHATDTTQIGALSNLALYYGVPVGVEVASDVRDVPTFDIDVKRSSLKDVLDLIASYDDRYRWEVRDGVINFIPTRSRDVFLEQLLSVRVRRFAPGRNLPRYAIRDAISELPEVREFLEARKVSATNLSPASREGKPRSGFEPDISDTDIRRILNAIVRESDYKIWVIQRLGAQKEYLQLSL